MDKFGATRVFVKIADAGNLSAAGRQLGLSLTSASRQLMALEEFLGTTLIERTTRHLSLTASGQLILRTGEADFGGGRRGGTRPDDADWRRVRPIACECSVAARSVAVGADAGRLFGGAEAGLDRSDPGGSAGPSRRGRYRSLERLRPTCPLDDIKLVVCGAPDYLSRRGEPAAPDDLPEQDCLAFGDAVLAGCALSRRRTAQDCARGLSAAAHATEHSRTYRAHAVPTFNSCLAGVI
jgi:Bacterial regulatory helix-turn-helix protein, lysR family